MEARTHGAVVHACLAAANRDPSRWERPDEFRRVFSAIGSFTNLRGGHVYPDLVLKSEPKPIRVFLQDGANDNRLRGKGPDAHYDPEWDWHAQNLKMAAALTEKKYDVNYTWGMNLHGQKFGGAIMPEMMRWLWRDGPVSTDPTDMVERSFRQRWLCFRRQRIVERPRRQRWLCVGR